MTFPKYEVGQLVEFLDYKFRYDKNMGQVGRPKYDPEKLVRHKLNRLTDTYGLIAEAYSAEEMFPNNKDAHIEQNNCYKWLSQIDLTHYYVFEDEICLVNEKTVDDSNKRTVKKTDKEPAKKKATRKVKK